MMPILPPWWDLVVLALCIGGFGSLALASNHAGRIVLGRAATIRQRLILRLIGWPLLVLALIVCVIGWHGNFGTFMWFGWMTMAALLVMLAVSYWPWRQQSTRQPRPQGRSVSERGAPSKPVQNPLWRRGLQGLIVLALIAIPAGFGWALHGVPVKPLLRDNVVQGKVGPWSFTLVEEEQGPPEIIGKGIPAKHLMLRFCDACDAEIRAAFAKVREPRLPRGVGLRFTATREAREVMLSFPPAATADDGVWLSVVGHDHQIHTTRIDIERLSPGTAQYLREKAP